jgi:hypothetical protein
MMHLICILHLTSMFTPLEKFAEQETTGAFEFTLVKCLCYHQVSAVAASIPWTTAAGGNQRAVGSSAS